MSVTTVVVTSPSNVAQQLTGLDANGVDWHLDSLDGWDGPEIRQDLHHAVKRRGAALGEWVYGPRILSAKGKFRAPTPALAWQTMDALAAACDCVEADGTLSVTDVRSIARTCTVRRSQRLMMKLLTDTVVDFDVELLAGDPAKYAASSVIVNQGVPGSFNYTSPGNYPTDRFTVLVVGSCINPRIQSATGQGGIVRFNVTLAGGDTLLADFYKKTVQINNVNRYDVVDPSSQWFPLMPGLNALALVTDGGGSTALTIYDAWI